MTAHGEACALSRLDVWRAIPNVRALFEAGADDERARKHEPRPRRAHDADALKDVLDRALEALGDPRHAARPRRPVPLFARVRLAARPARAHPPSSGMRNSGARI